MQDMDFVTTVSERGQTIVPAKIRRHLKLTKHGRLVWSLTKDGIHVAQLPDDPISALAGVFSEFNDDKPLTEQLIDEHRREVVRDAI